MIEGLVSLGVQVFFGYIGLAFIVVILSIIGVVILAAITPRRVRTEVKEHEKSKIEKDIEPYVERWNELEKGL